MDQRLRNLERSAQSGDPQAIANYLHALIHAGHYSMADSKLLAWLGYGPAKILHPRMFAKKNKLDKHQGRDVLLYAMQRIFLPPLSTQENLNANNELIRWSTTPQLDAGHRLLERLIRELIENFHILQLSAEENDLLDHFHLDVFQQRALRLLRMSLGLHTNIETINQRVRALCEEMIHSHKSEFNALKFFALPTGVITPEMYANLFPKDKYVYTRPHWEAFSAQLLFVSKIIIPGSVHEVEGNHNAHAYDYEWVAGNPPLPGEMYQGAVYPFPLRDFPADGAFAELRPLDSIIPKLLPPGLIY